MHYPGNECKNDYLWNQIIKYRTIMGNDRFDIKEKGDHPFGSQGLP